MASFMYTVLSIAQVASLQCSIKYEIAPCTCMPHNIMSDTLLVTCDGMGSFNQVYDALQNRLTDMKILLKITNSKLEDMETRSFSEMNMKILNLRLNFDGIKYLPESTFRNLSDVEFLSLSSNDLPEVPRHIFNYTHKVTTLDLASLQISRLYENDFDSLKHLNYLILVSNNLDKLDKGSIPQRMRSLHLGRNNLQTLNGTLRELEHLGILFINNNQLTTLDNELPVGSKTLQMILAHHNKLRHLPQDLKTMERLISLYFNNNELESLDGCFKHGSWIDILTLYKNKIKYLAEDEFQDAKRMESLDLAYNYIKSINNSLLPLASIRLVNFSHNLINEFSLNEIRGLTSLKVVDLSWNLIEKLSGKMENMVEPNLFMDELILDHNRLKTLDGAMMGLNKLHSLGLSHNKLRVISPDDLIGLEELVRLDISHNDLQTLEETSKTFLPKLTKLDASYNNITKLEKDFHGLPVLCLADLSNNRIETILPELVSNSRCTNNGVQKKLEIILQENPVLCKDDLPNLIAQMDAQEASLLGVIHCIVPQEDMPQVILPPSPELLKSILRNEQLSSLPNSIIQQSQNIVQVLLKNPIIIEKLPDETTTDQQLSPAVIQQQEYQQIFETSTETLIATPPPPPPPPTTTTATPLSTISLTTELNIPITLTPTEIPIDDNLPTVQNDLVIVSNLPQQSALPAEMDLLSLEKVHITTVPNYIIESSTSAAAAAAVAIMTPVSLMSNSQISDNSPVIITNLPSSESTQQQLLSMQSQQPEQLTTTEIPLPAEILAAATTPPEVETIIIPTSIQKTSDNTVSQETYSINQVIRPVITDSNQQQLLKQPEEPPELILDEDISITI